MNIACTLRWMEHKVVTCVGNEMDCVIICHTFSHLYSHHHLPATFPHVNPIEH